MADLLQKQTTLETLRIRAQAQGTWFFYFSLILFFLIAATYGGLFFLNRGQKEARNLLLEEIKFKEEELRPELLNQIFTLDNQLKNLRSLLARHVFTSNVLALLESNTLPRVRFTNFNLTAGSLKVDLTGEAANYAALAEQVAILERHPQIEKTEFGGLYQVSPSLVGFKLSLTLKPGLLSLKP